MSTNSTQQEILLMINTNFSSRQWIKKNETEKENKLSKKEQLKEACWNGLIPEILPECFEKMYDKSMTLWEINDADTFIDLDFGDSLHRKENRYSINPYAFMPVQGYN